MLLQGQVEAALAEKLEQVILTTDFSKESGIVLTGNFLSKAAQSSLYTMSQSLAPILIGKKVVLKFGSEYVTVLFDWDRIPYQTQIEEIQSDLGVESEDLDAWELRRLGVNDIPDLAERLGLPNRTLRLIAFLEDECSGMNLLLIQNALAVMAQVLQVFFSIRLTSLTLSSNNTVYSVADMLVPYLGTSELRVTKRARLTDYEITDIHFV